MGSRRKAREFALQMLFQEDLTAQGADEIRESFWLSRRTDADTRQFAQGLLVVSLEHRSQIDEQIKRCSEHWRLERMAAVDRNVLRLAVTEFLHFDTPAVVVIDEAIELARKFGGQDSAEFVNGILDAIRKDLEQDSKIDEDRKIPSRQ